MLGLVFGFLTDKSKGLSSKKDSSELSVFGFRIFRVHSSCFGVSVLITCFGDVCGLLGKGLILFVVAVVVVVVVLTSTGTTDSIVLYF